MIAAALAVISAVITVQAAIALAAGTRPGTSGLPLIAAAEAWHTAPRRRHLPSG